MSLRDLVTGSDMCTPSGGDGAGPSNAVGTLVHSLLGGASKAQEQLREVRVWGGAAGGRCVGLLCVSGPFACAAA